MITLTTQEILLITAAVCLLGVIVCITCATIFRKEEVCIPYFIAACVFALGTLASVIKVVEVTQKALGQ